MPRMYSSMPRISNEAWCSDGCGQRAMARLWCQRLIRRKYIIEPICGCMRVSDRAKPRCRSYQATVASGVAELTTTCESRTGIDSPSEILRCARTVTSELISTVRPSLSKKRNP